MIKDRGARLRSWILDCDETHAGSSPRLLPGQGALRLLTAPAAPDLDPARRSGETVGALAGDALRFTAEVLKAVEGGEADASAMLRHDAEVAGRLAPAVADAPLRNASHILAPTDLAGRFFTLTERMWTNAEVAGYLFDRAGHVIQTVTAVDSEVKNRLLLDGQRLAQVQTLLEIAPSGHLGPRLTELMPLLRMVRHSGETERLFAPALMDSLTADPAFLAAARDAFHAVKGRELDALPAAARATWCGRLAGPWLRFSHKGAPLTTSEALRLSAAVRAGGSPWSRPPGMPGPWTDLDAEDAAEVLHLLAAHHRAGPQRAPFPLAGFCDRVRVLPLSCFGGAMLIEVQGRVRGGETGIASFLLTDHDVLAVDGGSAWIHDLNEAVGPHLHDAAARLDYVRLFMNCVRHDGERFQPVESFEDLADRATDTEYLRTLCAGHARGIEAAGLDAHGRWLFLLVVCHRQSLYAAGLVLSPDGAVEMIDDRPLAGDVPVRSERMEGLFVMTDCAEPIP